MTDGSTGQAGQAWQPPQDPTAGTPDPSPYQQTPAAQQAPAAGSGAAPSWTAPARPGLIPLRPLTLGVVLSASFQALRRNPRPTLGIALTTQFIVTVVTAVLIGGFAWFSVGRLETASGENVDEIGAGIALMGLVLYAIPMALSMIAVALLQGVVVIEVSRAVLGEKLTLRQLWHRAKGRMGALIGWMLLLSLAMLVATAVLVAIVVVCVATLGAVGIALGVAVGVLGGLGFVVLAAWLSTKLSMVPSAIMIERLRLGAAVRRSWQLTGGHFWRIFGILLLVSVILGTTAQVISTPLSMFGPMLIGILAPTGADEATTAALLIGFIVLTLALTTALSAVILVVQSATTALLYVDLRMRKEGLDLELSRFVEERAVGTTTVDDPYRSPAAAAGAQAHGVPPAPPSDSPWA